MQISINFQVADDCITEVINVPSNASVTHSQTSASTPSISINKPRSAVQFLDNGKPSSESTNMKKPSNKSNRTSPTKTNSDSRQQWNSSTHVNKDAYDKAKPTYPESKCCDEQNRPKMAESKTTIQPQRNSRADGSAVEVERNARSTNMVRSQPINSTSIPRRPHSEFSSRWEPIPIRSSYPGRTTAGRWLYNGQNIYDPKGLEKPFYDRSPAGIPTIFTGSVDECMRWNYGRDSSSSGVNGGGQRTMRQHNNQDGRDLDFNVNIGISLDDDQSIRAGSNQA